MGNIILVDGTLFFVLWLSKIGVYLVRGWCTTLQ